jgi:soluble lytic murein transglycosylase-like protein
VAIAALREQRLVFRAAASATLAAQAPAVAGHAAALRELGRLTRPRPLSAFRVGPAPPAATLLRFYREAQARFGIDWRVLAAVNYVESDFDRLRNTSAAGAQGPMQFLPSTWRAYGLGGDVHDPHDAVLAAARYLRAHGAARDLRRALYAYNPSSAYVDAILRFAARMRREPDAFLVYYSRQLFVRTPSGRRRLTSFGLG